MFPANLISLTFTNCIMPKTRYRRHQRAFSGIETQIPNLQELRFEYCNFFEPNDVMPFSKLAGLRILSLRGCKKLKNCVPYLSLACRFGFKKLEVFDLRETNISDSELQCINALKTLRELYLEFPEADASEDDSESDSDFQFIFRGGRRRPMMEREYEPHIAPVAIERVDLHQNNESLSNNLSVINPSASGPSTSSQASETTTHAEVLNIDNEPQPSTSDTHNNLSSPESLSDSVPSSPSPPPDEGPTRTIVIRANMNSAPAGQGGLGNMPRIQVILGGDVPHASRYLQIERAHRMPLSITDRGILSFGVPRPNLLGNLVFLGNHPPDPNTYLERVVLRNFRNITDTTLSHLETNAPRIMYLDVRGCHQVTREAVERFKAARSNCMLLSNYDDEE